MQPTFNTLLITVNNNIATLVLNRPKKLNALSAECLEELAAAAYWFNQQKHIQVVLIKGAGRTFSAGADFTEFSNLSPQTDSWIERRDKGQVGFRMAQAIENMRAITIAQVHGFAVGGALVLMLACDFRIVAEDTFFSIPEIDLGIPLGWGGLPKLVSEIGPARAKELIMTCRRFAATEAHSLGVVNKVVPLDQLENHCLNFAQTLAAKPAVPLIMTKEQVNAVSQHIGAAYVGSAEGDMLLNAMKDSASQKAAQAYLAAVTKK